MGFGAGVFLVAVGAILTFAVHVTTRGFDLHTIGIILMIAGAAGVLLDLVFFAPRRRSTVSTTAYPASGQAIVQQRSDYV